MNIITLNPPFLPKFSRESRSPGVAKSGTLYYPMWLAYATGVLEKNGFNVRLIDAPARDYTLDDVKADFAALKPRLCVIDTSTPSFHNDIKVVDAIKTWDPGVFTLVVGRHVSALPEESIAASPNTDAVAMGEYDYIVRDCALALRDGAPLSTVKGLLWRDAATGRLVKNEPMPLIEDLDEIPFVSSVYKRHLNIEDYFYAHSQYPIVTIITGRGCPHHCIYCCYPQTMYGHKLRLRSPDRVAEEFRYIADNFPAVKEIMIEDDTLTVNRRHAEAIADRLIAMGNRIPFSANSRADLTDVQALSKLRKAGCRLFCVGYESGSQQVLDSIKKGVKLEKTLEFAHATKKAGIMVHGCFMVGNPGETHETMTATLNHAKRLKPDTAQFYPIMVYPGTEAYRLAETEGNLLTRDFSAWLTDEGMHNCVVQAPGLSARELVEFCDHARRSFYLAPGYMARKAWQSLFSIDEFKRNARAFKRLVKYLARGSFRNNGSDGGAECRPGARS